MTDKKYSTIIKLLIKKYGYPKTELNYKTPFQLLVATILSAQCTDKRVNIVTKKIFQKYKTPEDFIELPLNKLELLIKSTGFYKNKAKNIKLTSKKLVDNFNSEIPDNMKDLTTLNGVARKTANVVLNHIFNKSEGIVVDTHVKRLSNRIGFSKETNPNKIERELMELLPKKYWIIISGLLIQHGRNICKARKPDCDNCVIANHCAYYSNNK